jgi:hypothetical protein
VAVECFYADGEGAVICGKGGGCGWIEGVVLVVLQGRIPREARIC